MPMYSFPSRYRVKTGQQPKVSPGVLRPLADDDLPVLNQKMATDSPQDNSSPNTYGAAPETQLNAPTQYSSKFAAQLASSGKIDPNGGSRSRMSGLKKLMPAPGMKRFATGETVTDPTVGIVGENGPEIIADANPTQAVEAPTQLPPIDQTAIDPSTVPIPTREKKEKEGIRKLAEGDDADAVAPQAGDTSNTPPAQPALVPGAIGVQTNGQAVAAPAQTANDLPATPVRGIGGYPIAQPTSDVQDKQAAIDAKIAQKAQLQSQLRPAQNNWAQRLGLAALSLTKFAPIANQLIHPKWTEQQRGVNQQINVLSQQQQDLQDSLAADALAEQREANAAYKNAQIENQGDIADSRKQRNTAYAQAQQDRAHSLFVQSLGPNAIQLGPTDQPPQGYHAISDPTNPNVRWVSRSAFVPLPDDATFLSLFPGKKAGDQVTTQEYDQGMKDLRTQQGERIKASNVVPNAAAAQNRLQALQKKMAMAGELPVGALENTKTLYNAALNSKTLTDDEKGDLISILGSRNTPESQALAGVERMVALGNTRPQRVFDTANNSVTEVFPDDIHNNPGRYTSETEGTKILGRQALFSEIDRNIAGTEGAIKNMPELTPTQRMGISMYLRSDDPKSALPTFLKGEIGKSLTPEQLEYVQWLPSLNENAIAMRQAGGMGSQGSDMVRQAVIDTLPSPKDPSNAAMLGRIAKMKMVVNTLKQGVPNLGTRGGGLNVGQNKIPTISNKADFDALPKNAKFIDASDGKTYTK